MTMDELPSFLNYLYKASGNKLDLPVPTGKNNPMSKDLLSLFKAEEDPLETLGSLAGHFDMGKNYYGFNISVPFGGE